MVAGGGDWDDIGKDVGTVACPTWGQINLVVYPDTQITCYRYGCAFTADWWCEPASTDTEKPQVQILHGHHEQ